MDTVVFCEKYFHREIHLGNLTFNRGSGLYSRVSEMEKICRIDKKLIWEEYMRVIRDIKTDKTYQQTLNNVIELFCLPNFGI